MLAISFITFFSVFVNSYVAALFDVLIAVCCAINFSMVVVVSGCVEPTGLSWLRSVSFSI